MPCHCIAIFMSASKSLSDTRVTCLEADTPLPLVILHCPHNNGLYLASGEAGIPSIQAAMYRNGLVIVPLIHYHRLEALST